MTKKSDAPAIRFKGFSDAWEQRKWINTVDISTNMVDPKSGKYDLLPHVAPGNIESFTGRLYDNVKLVGEENLISGKFVFNVGDIVYGKINPQLGKYVFARFSGLTSADAYVLNAKNGIVQKFLYAVIQTRDFYDYSVSVSKRSGMPKINRDELNAYSYWAPSESEQLKIGEYLLTLDHLITLHQRKFEKLTNVKKSMLEKMFPQNGSSYPEIRFKGFTDPWEQREVGDLLIERSQQAPMSDEYPLMAFIANEGVAPKGERYDRSALVTDTVNKLYKKTEKGDFIYSSNNLETGSIGLNKYGKACISPVYSIFEPTGIADSDFLGRRLVRKDFINAMVKWRQGVIYGQWRIHESDFLKIEISVPSVEEQRKIGAYLDQLDNLITLHQRELKKLQNIKKSMLEKMFV